MRRATLAACCIALALGCSKAPSETDIQAAVTRAVLRRGHRPFNIYDHKVDSLRVLEVGPSRDKYWRAKVRVVDSFTIAADSERGALEGVHSSYYAIFQINRDEAGVWDATFDGNVVSDLPPGVIGVPHRRR